MLVDEVLRVLGWIVSYGGKIFGVICISDLERDGHMVNRNTVEYLITWQLSIMLKETPLALKLKLELELEA